MLDHAPDRACRDGRGAALDTTAKTVGRSDAHRAGRAARFRQQRHAVALLKGTGIGRVGTCRWAVVSKAAGVDVALTTYGDGSERAHYQGLQTCGSVWLCPCCSARISETRRGELNALLAWARSEGHQVFMGTFTARHGARDELAPLLDRMKIAKKRMHQHRAWRRIKIVMLGTVTATEVTGGGRNGWHPHFHVLFVVQAGAEIDPDELREAWLASLRGAGLSGAGAGFSWQDATAAGRYVGKWGAAEEVALGGEKKGRAGGGRSPSQLLAASSDEGDRRAGALWRDYAQAFHGRRQLVWSRGLKALAGVGEVDDATAAEDAAQDGQTQEKLTNITHGIWQDSHGLPGAKRRRGRILDAAEETRAAGVWAVIGAGGTDPPGPDPDPEVIEG